MKTILLPLLLALLAAEPAHDDATVRHGFEDVERWAKVFDDPARDAWQKPAALVKALGIAPGDRVADLGAGTGYFEPYLSRAVGEAGTVYAVEVEPKLVEHIRTRAEKEGTANVIPVLASLDNPRLPRGQVDLVLVVNTVHHIDARIRYFRAMKDALTPRGRVAIVDWGTGEIPVGPPPEHRLPKKQVGEEMAEAGYEPAGDPGTLLPYQYVLLFRPRPSR